MSFNSKIKEECLPTAGPTSAREGSGEQWKRFWATAKTKTKKRRKKPLTREESKRRKQVKHARKNRKKVVEILNDKKPHSRLAQDPSIAELLTTSDWFDLLNGEKPTERSARVEKRSSLELCDSRETFRSNFTTHEKRFMSNVRIINRRNLNFQTKLCQLTTV